MATETFGEIISRTAIELVRCQIAILEKEAKEMLSEHIKKYESDGHFGIAASLKLMNDLILSEQYELAKAMHQRFISDYGLQMTIIAKSGWENARVAIIPVNTLDGRLPSTVSDEFADKLNAIVTEFNAEFETQFKNLVMRKHPELVARDCLNRLREMSAKSPDWKSFQRHVIEVVRAHAD